MAMWVLEHQRGGSLAPRTCGQQTHAAFGEEFGELDLDRRTIKRLVHVLSMLLMAVDGDDEDDEPEKDDKRKQPNRQDGLGMGSGTRAKAKAEARSGPGPAPKAVAKAESAPTASQALVRAAPKARKGTRLRQHRAGPR